MGSIISSFGYVDLTVITTGIVIVLPVCAVMYAINQILFWFTSNEGMVLGVFS